MTRPRLKAAKIRSLVGSAIVLDGVPLHLFPEGEQRTLRNDRKELDALLQQHPELLRSGGRQTVADLIEDLCLNRPATWLDSSAN